MKDSTFYVLALVALGLCLKTCWNNEPHISLEEYEQAAWQDCVDSSLMETHQDRIADCYNQGYRP